MTHGRRTPVYTEQPRPQQSENTGQSGGQGNEPNSIGMVSTHGQHKSWGIQRRPISGELTTWTGNKPLSPKIGTKYPIYNKK